MMTEQPQQRLFKMLLILKLLTVDRLSVSKIQHKTGYNERTIYRYLNMLVDAKFGIVKKKNGRQYEYHVSDGDCPFCKQVML